MSYLAYTKEDLCKAVLESTSIAQVLKKLNLKPVGGNYGTIHKKIIQYNLSTEHFTGQLWSKGLRLKEFKEFTRPRCLKPHLIKERGHRCENCQLENWQEGKIPLELHHIDGNHFNNSIENLQLLCPNCHSITDNFRKKKT